jgi:hypothetical protein
MYCGLCDTLMPLGYSRLIIMEIRIVSLKRKIKVIIMETQKIFR